MDTLNISGLNRNPDVIKKSLVKIGNSLVTKKNLRVIFPDRYNDINLAIIGSTVRLVSIFAIIDDNGNYSVANLPIFVDLSPSNIGDIEVDGIMNKVLYFEEGSVFMENIDLMVDNRFLYDLFNEFYISGKIPWFMNYDDTMKIFEKTKKYANSDLGENPITFEILASIISRLPSNKAVYYREAITSVSDIAKTKPNYVGLMNIYYTFANTISKIAGNYFTQGLNSALVNKETEVTKIETMLRA